jgi:hypothetical protein
LSPHISVFHGKISAGKSSIARLIDFSLGGALERTTAIARELVSVKLEAEITQYTVLFEREAVGSNQVQVTWRNVLGESSSVLAPLQSDKRGPVPIWENHIYNLSDLIFYLMGITPLKVSRSKSNPDSPLVRLSFRDLMWYCYLSQEDLDSSFYELNAPFKQTKSRDVMMMLVGYYTEKLNSLQLQLDEVRTEQSHAQAALRHITEFLEQVSYGSEDRVRSEIEWAQQALALANAQLVELRDGFGELTHFADELRGVLRDLSERLAYEEQALRDLEYRIRQQESLRAELYSAKFKLARTESAVSILSGVQFDHCPQCGSVVDGRYKEEDCCRLCGRNPSKTDDDFISQAEIMRRDLTSRIDELETSIRKHKESHVQQKRKVSAIRIEKSRLDDQLAEELRFYDSAYLARARETERQAAIAEENIRNLNKTLEMFRYLADLRGRLDELAVQERKLRRQIEEEKATLTNADQLINQLEQAYLDALLNVGVPGVGPEDHVKINRTTWIPYIIPANDEHDRWSFFNAGSGGKKTLVNACYALAVHKIAAENELPLPEFLIIDTPMKNIGEDVNRDLFESFYRYLYSLAAGPLSETQFVIIDKEFISPYIESLEVYNRYMTPNEDDHPPLIPYYRGP